MSDKPLSSKDEFAERGDALYENEIAPRIQPGTEGNFVAIDIETGEFEVGRTELAASERLLERKPNAQFWLRRIGARYLHRFGSAQSRQT